VLLLVAALGVVSCRQDMHDQPRYKPFSASDFFGDGRSERPLVAGTIARGHLRDDEHLYAGRVDGQHATTFPVAIDAGRMRRGQERFDIFCAPCHGRIGDGDGMIVRRGYRRPPSLHDDRLRQSPVGHYIDVMTNGFGAMPDYRVQVPAEDQWAITAYIRALQFSQRATAADVPATAPRGPATPPVPVPPPAPSPATPAPPPERPR
jgi:mono/diheme cytochrome c family protein